MLTHFLQTEVWGTFQTALKREWLHHKNPTWSALAIVENGKFANRLYCPYGPTLKTADALADATAWLKHEASQRSLDFVRIEPLLSDMSAVDAKTLRAHGWRPAYKYVQPQETIRVDLKKPVDEVLQAMSQTARNLYRNIHKKGVAFSESNNPADMKELIKMLAVVANRTGMRPRTANYLQIEAETLITAGKAKLFIASQDNQPLAMALVYTDDTTWYYAHAASYEAARKLSVMHPLVAHIIVAAHAAGATCFDLYGIARPYMKPPHPLVAITKFKESFGGERHDFSGAWELPLKPWRCRFYNLARRITKS